MTKKITHENKEAVIEVLKTVGTKIAAAEIVGISVRVINLECQRSEIYNKRVEEARNEGRAHLGETSVEMIKLIASGKLPKTDRNVLTANIVLANAYSPGFKGVTTIQGKVDHSLTVKTGIPRPKRKEVAEKPAIEVIGISKSEDPKR